MHVNNEIGNILDIELVGNICHQYGAIFHSDMVQSIGHSRIDLNALPVDLASCSGHKIHGPKGVGFLYIKKGVKLSAQSYGGSQEREVRLGTENLNGIIGFYKSIQISILGVDEINEYVLTLKKYFITQIKDNFASVGFNGQSGSLTHGVNSLVNVNFPEVVDNNMLLFQLDLNGVCASGASACSSGAASGSHVLNKIKTIGSSVRFSFNKNNTKKEIDVVIDIIKKIIK